MTLHIVLGDGYMPTKELTAHLEDLKAKAYADNDGFWFLVQAKAEPTDTDRALVKWLSTEDYDLYWDAIGDKDAADKIYAGAQSIHKATRLAPKVVQMMEQAKAGGVDEDSEVVEPEGADLLALFFSDEEDAEEDRWLNDVISAVADAGFPVFAFNDGMTPIEPGDIVSEEEAAEELEIPVTATVTATVTYTREQLSEMDLDELKKIAVEKGVEVAPRSRKPTYVDAILGEEEQVPEVEIDAPPPLTMVPPLTTSNTTFTAAAYLSSQEVSGPAMVIIIQNGTVTSRVVTAAQAQALLNA